MRKIGSGFIAVVMIGFLLPVCFAQETSEAQYEELPNFHKVNERLYRGAQPKLGGIERLARLGIKTVINLRGEDERARKEEAEARRAGLRYFSVPMGRWGRPTNEQVESVLSIINAEENQPVFIHCKRGSDRTGIIIAVYRIVHDGWSGEEALEEAERLDMFWWKFKMKDFISDYYRDRMRRADTSMRHKFN